MIDNLTDLSSLWLSAKAEETHAVEKRRAIEDRIKTLSGVSDAMDGTETVSPDGYVIKMVGRTNRAVDGDKLQELAAEAGVSEHLSSLFRWKPEINMAAWRATDMSITALLAGAITTKPGRLSFSITPKE